MRFRASQLLLALTTAAALTAGTADAGTLKVNVASRGNQRATWQAVFDQFRKANPDIDLKVSYVAEEAYKVQMSGWLATDPPDVLSWNNGERLAYFAKRGLIEDLGQDWQKNGWNDTYAAVKQSSTYGGKVYSLPLGYDAYGLFYRKDLFEKAGIHGEPADWPQFLDACRKLKAAGIAPIAVAARDAWTLAAWFDYLDLRINGYAFHQKLMAGDVAYTDPRVRAVYAAWKKLIDDKYFIDNALSYDVDALSPLIVNGQAAMTLMGTWYSAGLLSATHNPIGFFRFPVIDASVPLAEDGPVNVMVVPAKAHNKADARRLLAFMGQPAISGEFAKGMGQLPSNNRAPEPQDPISKIGFHTLAATQGGIAQFYDRDMTKEMADEGMKAMQQFLSDPTQLDAVLQRLEQTRKRIYRK